MSFIASGVGALVLVAVAKLLLTARKSSPLTWVKVAELPGTRKVAEWAQEAGEFRDNIGLSGSTANHLHH